MSFEAVCEREAWKRVWSSWRANDSQYLQHWRRVAWLLWLPNGGLL